MGAQEFVRTLTQGQRRSPLDQFVRGADGENDADHNEDPHSATPDALATDQDLARHQGRDKALKEVGRENDRLSSLTFGSYMSIPSCCSI